ncbi:right-handed parallel beta-helix repeat-containing protein [Novilysobacter erysipheiresistens]|uniref:Right-handed parallel beta-helix repeat-containing protein n=1 Tax=Novilysobacter erysipheiresistens TaxID=1749332 RepID=A0ABU7YYI4_9GAMM
MNRDNQAVQIVNDPTTPRRTFLRNSLLLAVPLVMGGTAFSAAAAVFVPPTRTRGTAVINVRDHGATGNGSTDDTAAFARAIAALPDTGGTVVVPEGDYLLDASRSLRLRSRMHLQLAPTARLVAKPNSLDRYYVLDVHEADDVEISGGQIVGERHQHLGTTGEWGQGIMVRGCNRVTIRDIRISDCWGDGISVAGVKVTTRTAPWRPSDDVVVANVVCTGNRRQGMSIGAVRNMKVYDSEFSNTRGIEPGCGIDIEPNKFNLDRAENIQIENCLIRGNEGNGILVYHRVKYVTIKRCQIEHNDGFGVLTMGATKGYVALNRIKHNRLDGLCVGGGTADYTVSGNYFRNNTTRNQGLVGVDATWAGTNWTAMTGLVAGRNGNQSHISVIDTATNTRINRNFYSK